jgi:RHS repeat-associated protein
VAVVNNHLGTLTGDLDRDGGADVDDQYAVMMNWASALAIAVVSAPDEDNQIGFSGYIYNGETQIYTIRFRHYDAVLGRWIGRDPLGYVDGSNLCEYVGGMPLAALDSLGLFWRGRKRG